MTAGHDLIAFGTRRLAIADAVRNNRGMTDIHAMLQRQIVDLWSHGRLEIVDAMYAETCTDHMPVPGQASGRPGLRQAVQMFRAALPDLDLRLVRTLAQGTPAAGWGVDVWQLTGTHSGAPLFGLPASGRAVAFAGIDWLRIAGGQVRELWHIEDMAAMADQLGMAIPPQAAPPVDAVAAGAPPDLPAAAWHHLAGWRTNGGPIANRLPGTLALAAASDLQVQDLAWLQDGPRIACRRLISGTHSGAPLFGLPARGRRFAINAMAVVELGADGNVAHSWQIADLFALRGQIGA